jgi:hypothetical protein
MSQQKPKKPEINTFRFLFGALLGFLFSLVIFITLVAFMIEEGRYYYREQQIRELSIPPLSINN